MAGIYREISDNHKNSASALTNKGIVDAIKTKLLVHEAAAKGTNQRPFHRPFVIVTESSDFYSSVSMHVTSLHVECLVAIRDYYRDVADQHLFAKAIEGEAYLTLSVESKCGTMDDLWKAFEESHRHGQAALDALEKRYPKWCKSPKVKP